MYQCAIGRAGASGHHAAKGRVGIRSSTAPQSFCAALAESAVRCTPGDRAQRGPAGNRRRRSLSADPLTYPESRDIGESMEWLESESWRVRQTHGRAELL